MPKHRQLFFTLIHLLLMLALLTPFIINVSFAQNTKPKTPEFTLKLVEHPYNVAPITTKNPYTGETTITQEGYHNTNRTIELKIKNQPFTPYETTNGNYVTLCYNISIKGHYDDKWTHYPDYWRKIPLTASQDDYTTITFSHNSDKNDRYSYYFWIPDNGQLDFRVEALIGYYTEKIEFFPPMGSPIGVNTFTGQTSGWSNTQTITINDNSPTSPPTTTTNTTPTNPTPTTPQTTNNTKNPNPLGSNTWTNIILITLLSTIVVLLAIIAVYLHRKNVSQFNSTLHTNIQLKNHRASKSLAPLSVSTYFARYSVELFCT